MLIEDNRLQNITPAAKWQTVWSLVCLNFSLSKLLVTSRDRETFQRGEVTCSLSHGEWRELNCKHGFSLSKYLSFIWSHLLLFLLLSYISPLCSLFPSLFVLCFSRTSCRLPTLGSLHWLFPLPTTLFPALPSSLCSNATFSLWPPYLIHRLPPPALQISLYPDQVFLFSIVIITFYHKI